MRRIALIVMTICFGLGANPVIAQEAIWGGIVGTVVDNTGAVIPQATIVITNADTGVASTVRTDSRGDYQDLKLTPGTYKVSITSGGFRTFVRLGLHLDGGLHVRVNGRLELGAAVQTVVVAGATPQINTETANTSVDIMEHATWALPNSAAQVFPDVYNQLLNGYADLNNSAFSVGGTLSTESAEIQDGMRMEGQADVMGGTRGIARPSIDAVEDLVVTTSNFSAKYPQQAAVEITVKSGTNKWRGDLWYQNGNTAFNAAQYYTDQKAPFHLSQYGGSIGGPIVKDRAFIFFSYQGFQFPTQVQNISTIPDADMRTGNLSEFLDPSFLKASGFSSPITVNDPQTGQPFPGNIIPANLISPVSAAVMALYPKPNLSPPFINNLFVDGLLIRKESDFDIRGDYYFSPTQHSYARFTYFHSPNAESQSSLPGFGGNYFIDNGRTLTIHHTSTVTPRLLNDAMFGMFLNNTPLGPGLFSSQGSQTAWSQKLGIAGIPTNQDYGFPLLNFQQTDITAPFSYAYGQNDEYIYELKDEVTLTRGRHLIEIGFDFRRDEQGSNLPGGAGQGNAGTCQFGCMSFTGRWTGLDLGDFLLGYPATSSRKILSAPDFRNRNEWGGYVQDEIRVTPKLNLSLGLRYDYFPIVQSAHGLESLFDPAKDVLVVPSQKSIDQIPANSGLTIPVLTASEAGYPSSLLQSNKNDWSPRIGFDYRLLDSTVVRGGFGIYHTGLINTGEQLLQGPFQATSNFPIVQPPAGAAPTLTIANPYVGGSTGNALLNFFAPDNVNDPRHLSYDLAVEHQWKANAFTAEYEGKRSSIAYQPQLNAIEPSSTPFSQSELPFPALGSVSGEKNGARYQSDALRLDARRRFANGLLFDLTYVFSKTIDSLGGISGETGGSPENPFDLARDRGVSYFMPPSRLTANYVYQLPFGKGSLAFPTSGIGNVGNVIVRGWETAGTYNWQTSPPLNVSGSFINAQGEVYDAPNTNTLYGRPDYTGQKIKATAAQTAQGFVFNPNAFTRQVPEGRYGDVGTSALWAGPNSISINQSFFRNLRIPWFRSEQANFRVGCLMYNALNHANTSAPVTNMDSPLFGKRQTPTDGEIRTIMLQGRIEF